MFVAVASKIRRLRRPSRQTSARSDGLADWWAAAPGKDPLSRLSDRSDVPARQVTRVRESYGRYRMARPGAQGLQGVIARARPVEVLVTPGRAQGPRSGASQVGSSPGCFIHQRPPSWTDDLDELAQGSFSEVKRQVRHGVAWCAARDSNPEPADQEAKVHPLAVRLPGIMACP